MQRLNHFRTTPRCDFRDQFVRARKTQVDRKDDLAPHLEQSRFDRLLQLRIDAVGERPILGLIELAEDPGRI